MKVICAWCEALIADEPHLDVVATYPITHGICSSCRSRLNPTARSGPLERYLDELLEPVMLVTGSGEVRFANRKALALLDKAPEQVTGYRGGDVMECIYAKLPEGCGNTRHCAACTIRRTVTRTFEMGEPQVRVPAHLNRINREVVTPVAFVISTEKAGGIVLLRIDEVL